MRLWNNIYVDFRFVYLIGIEIAERYLSVTAS